MGRTKQRERKPARQPSQAGNELPTVAGDAPPATRRQRLALIASFITLTLWFAYLLCIVALEWRATAG
jgi:hypothetical protein